MATARLAKWATELTSLTPSAQKAAARALYNYVGCAIGGSTHPTTIKAYDAVRPFFGPSTSILFGCQALSKTDAQHAALLNGIASHVHDYDDTHLDTIIHPTGPVASAALAYAGVAGAVSGAQLLLALTAGMEVSCKLGLAVWPSHYDIGWHITSTTGSIGAAVAVGKLMSLTQEQMLHAVGIAATQVVGLRDMFGTDTKAFHPGRAAQAGLMAAVLAQNGYTSSRQALEAKRGWANLVVGHGAPQLDRRVAELGQSWEMERNAFKPFPCGIVCHPVIDAAMQIHTEMQSRGLAVEDVSKVDARVHPLVEELTFKRTPSDGLEAKFSVFHGAAAGLLFGKAGPAQYADAVVTDSALVDLRHKVQAISDQTLSPDEAHLAVEFRGGIEVRKHVRHAVGSLEVPMTNDQLSDKFIDQCTPVLGAQGARHASQAAWAMEDAADITGLLSSL